MRVIYLLFRTAIDYELTHQVALYTLLAKSKLPSLLVGINDSKHIEWEPQGQLFDLAVADDQRHAYIELKMWSSLTDSQIQRQQDFLASTKHSGIYILLGTSWFEFDSQRIQKVSKGASTRVGYDELIDALNKLLITPGQSADVYELALAYRNALQDQFTQLKTAALSPKDRGKLYYYSLYWMLKEQLQGLKTAIYSATNPGGPVYILNNQEWYPVFVNGVSVELYYEVVNDRLCIKFFADTDDANKKYMVRDSIRRATHAVLDSKYSVIDTGRLGAYMTACQINHDIGDSLNLDKSAQIFRDVHIAFPQIVQAIQPVAS
jgi:hypothetical protein